MSEWKKVKLGEICEITAGGDKPQVVSNYRTKDCTIPIYSNGIDNEGLYGFTNKAKNSGNAITITGRGANVGTVFFRKEPFLPIIRLLTLNPDANFIDARYLYYLLKGKTFLSTGSAQPQITVPNIEQYEIEYNPDIPTQLRIATILSRYDTLIENYQKQIKLLEEAAQRLYKEWFVELRFPGHENTKMVDGLPEGWERKKLIEFGCSLESGARPKGGVDSNLKDGIPSVGAENVIGLGKYNYSSEKLVTNQFYSQMRKGKIKDRDILIYKDGAYIGRTSLFQDGFPHKEMAVNEHVFLLHTLNENYQYYVFFTLYQKQYFEKMQKLNKNAAQPGLNQKALLDLVMLCPSENYVLLFRNAIEPLMKALFSKANQIRLLTEARDRLLPRLMGGEMEV